MKTLRYISVVFLLLTIFSFSEFESDEKLNSEGITAPVFYPYGVLSNIMNCEQCSGVRFYKALYPNDAPVTLMAVSVTRGADTKDAVYHLYQGIVNNSALITPLRRSDAEKSCANLGLGNCFAVTFTKSELNALLTTRGASGIVLMDAYDQNGNETLRAVAANIENNTIIPVTGGRAIQSIETCPNACGATPQTSYLCDMTN